MRHTRKEEEIGREIGRERERENTCDVRPDLPLHLHVQRLCEIYCKLHAHARTARIALTDANPADAS